MANTKSTPKANMRMSTKIMPRRTQLKPVTIMRMKRARTMPARRPGIPTRPTNTKKRVMITGTMTTSMAASTCILWLDPTNAKAMASEITRSLAEVDPANKTAYETNLSAVNAQIDALDAEIAAQLKTGAREAVHRLP